MMPTLAQNASPMSMLRTGISASSAFDPDGWDDSPEAEYRKAMRLIAETPTLIATFDRLRTGREVIPPHPELEPRRRTSCGCCTARSRTPSDAKVLDTTFVLYADHTMNASTFTARVIASTLSDMFSAITGAIGALKGPLHGGANEEAQKMAEEVGKPENAEAYVRERLGEPREDHGVRARRLPHDGSAGDGAEAAVQGSSASGVGQPQWYEIFAALEATTLEQKGLYPNVDLYAAGVYHMLGIPTDLMTPAVRARAHGRLDRARARAVREQPHHPAGLRLRRAARPNVRPDRGAPMSDHTSPGRTTAAPPPAPPARPADERDGRGLARARDPVD